jgi:hypothetical protein
VVLTVDGLEWQASGIDWEAEMNGGERQSLFGGHAGKSVVGDGGSLDAFYRLEGRPGQGPEGMRPMAIVDLKCFTFGVEGVPWAETVEGRGGDGACI